MEEGACFPSAQDEIGPSLGNLVRILEFSLGQLSGYLGTVVLALVFGISSVEPGKRYT